MTSEFIHKSPLPTDRATADQSAAAIIAATPPLPHFSNDNNSVDTAPPATEKAELSSPASLALAFAQLRKC